jgi:Ca2+-binding EF-hand superfamily protein
MKSKTVIQTKKSKSPGRGEINVATENIGEIAIINQSNIAKVKEFMENVTSKSSALNNKKISAIKNANSLKTLKESGFFNFDFFDNKTSATHFNISQEEIEKVFRLIDKKNLGTKVTKDSLKEKMKVINPKFPEDQIMTLTNGKSEMKASELFELLKDNELANFDPIAEVFRILDKDNKQAISIDHLQQIFQDLMGTTMDDKDKDILRECLTLEGESKITLESFKKLFSYLKDSEEVEHK